MIEVGKLPLGVTASREDILKAAFTGEYLSGIIEIDLNDVINNDLEGFLDIISERLCGSTLLLDVDWKIAGSTTAEDSGCGSILLNVWGDVSMVAENLDKTEDENDAQKERKGTLTSIWDGETEIETPCVVYQDGSIESEHVSVTGLNNIDKEFVVFDDDKDTEHSVCPNCHGYILKPLNGESYECPNPDCCED